MITINNYLIIEFILIFFRVISVIVIIPFIGSSIVPGWVKIGMAFFLSIIMFPLVSKLQPFPAVSFASFVLLVVSQVLIGMILGFLVLIVFTGVELAGSFSGLQIGFGMISVLNPLISNEQVSLIANMENFITLMLFIETSAFFLIIQGLYKSFQTIPLDFISFSPFIFKYLVAKANDIFIIGFYLSMPVVVVAVLLNVIVAFMGRLAPQFNIFAVGFPIIIIAGLIVIYLFVPYFSDFVINSFVKLKHEFYFLINYIPLAKTS